MDAPVGSTVEIPGTREIIEIRLIGEVQVRREGRAVALPASKKTRALLGYLVATGRPHLRERLCDLLWEGPGDPRAELRWSLSKLRPILNHRIERLHADRERVAFDPQDVEVDLASVRTLLAPGITHVPLDVLRRAAGMLEGELLDGLDLHACPRYHEWCIGEREAVSELRIGTLQELVARLGEHADQALAYARMLIAADPLSETGHATVVRLLGALGRTRDALAHYQYSRRLLESELAAPLAGELEAARRAMHRATGVQRAPVAARTATRFARADTPSLAVPFVGRQIERAQIDQQVARAAAGTAWEVTALFGEPGIGKSRLLGYLAERIAAAGGLVLAARAFEAEIARSYGVWVDALRGLALTAFPEHLRQDLTVLLPELGAWRNPTTATGDRVRLFDAAASLLRDLAQRHRLLALVLDDLQWADEASCALAHYVARAFGGASNLLFVCAARPGELEDNPAAINLLHSLRREQRLREIVVGPLSADETALLVKAVAPTLDGAAIASASEGNPFFALELAQARAGGMDWTERSLGSLISAQLARLDPRSRDVLTYAAALGRAFTPELLAPACGFDPTMLVAALGELERRALIRAVGEERYDFAHDLVRHAAYRAISQPRRRLLHAQIARSLALAAESDESCYPELARHAAAAGEHELAARACAEAGERCLRAFANVDAITLAEMGLRHVVRLAPGAQRIRLHVALLRVKLLAHAGPGLRRLPEIAGELSELIAAAEHAGLSAEAAAGHHLMSVWYQEAGEHARAQESTLRAASASRAADEATRTRQLATTARCLLELERDIERARALQHEAATVARPLGFEIIEVDWGEALVRRWDGDADAAVRSLEKALAAARHIQDRWREYKCLTLLMMLELERGGWERMEQHAVTLLAVGSEMGEDDVPFARVLRALAKARDRPEADGQLAAALDALRAASDKSLLAYALDCAAAHALERGRSDIARAWSTEALAAAEAVHRSDEALIAQALLARCALQRGEESTTLAALERLQAVLKGTASVSARARAAVNRAHRAAGTGVPTPVPTMPDSDSV